jgi:hypothetical protein
MARFATLQLSENHLSRDFRDRSIFDFCNNPEQTFGGAGEN